MKSRVIAIASCAVFVGALTATVASPVSAVPPPDSLKFARQKSGPYKETPVKMTVNAGQRKTFYLESRSDESPALDILIEDNEPDYRLKYFKGKNNITDEVTDEGYFYEPKASGVKFRVTVKRPAAGPATDCVVVNAEDAQAVIGFNKVCT